MGQGKAHFQKWWGHSRMAPMHATRWTVGPTMFIAQRESTQWLLGVNIGPKPATPRAKCERDVNLEIADLDDDPHWDLRRFAFDRTGAGIELRPALADRPVVSELEIPLQVLPGQTVHFFLTTPLWAQFLVDTDDAEPAVLADLPVVRPSDTWTGSSPIQGTMGYASSTRARMRLEDTVRLPHRALTEVVVKNRTKESLLLEDLQVPTESLELFVDEHNLFWTSQFSLRFANVDEGPTVKVYKTAAEARKGPPLSPVSEARAPITGVMSLLQALALS